jgi:DNA-directed RNA polymerase specialized sigma24 family protein
MEINIENFDEIRKLFLHTINCTAAYYVQMKWFDDKDIAISFIDENLLSAIRKWDETRKNNCSFKSFFLTHNKCMLINYLKKLKMESDSVSLYDPIDMNGDEDKTYIDIIVGEKSFLDTIEACDLVNKIKQKKPKFSEFLDRVKQGFTIAEIAEMEQKSEQTIHHRMKRLRKVVKKIEKER